MVTLSSRARVSAASSHLAQIFGVFGVAIQKNEYQRGHRDKNKQQTDCC